MANHKSAAKRARQSEKRRQRNAAVRSRLRTCTKKFNIAVQSGDKELAQSLLAPVCREWDKSVAKSVVHKNTAARKKSRLAVKVNNLLVDIIHEDAKSKKTGIKAKSKKKK
jgi:small subunit ribosomal protein S20